jgi:acyl-CoA thioester hydrolase
MTTFKLHSEQLKEEWLDAYGHLNEAYYLVPFSNTTWLLQDQFALGKDYFAETGCAIYTVETHLRYLNEVRYPATLEIESIILGSAPKKIWFAHQMLVNQKICATAEFMVLHYDTRNDRTSPIPEKAGEMLKQVEVAETPDWAGRRISLI